MSALLTLTFFGGSCFWAGRGEWWFSGALCLLAAIAFVVFCCEDATEMDQHDD